MKNQQTASTSSTCQAWVVATGLATLALLSPLNAQPLPGPPPTSLAGANQTTTIEGTVAQYLMNPDGVVDGLLLEHNAIVRFPPHLGQVLAGTVSPHDVVRVEG